MYLLENRYGQDPHQVHFMDRSHEWYLIKGNIFVSLTPEIHIWDLSMGNTVL